MERCSRCRYWTVQRKTVYGDGSEIVTFQATDGHGWCDVFNRETEMDFGCVKGVAADADNSATHVAIFRKDGEQCDHFTMVPCPDCEGRGSTNSRACRRCSGTAYIRRYDDGYLSDATWDHPKVKERKRLAKIAAKLEDPNLELQPQQPPQSGVL